MNSYKGYPRIFYFILDSLMWEDIIRLKPYILIMLTKLEAYVSTYVRSLSKLRIWYVRGLCIPQYVKTLNFPHFDLWNVMMNSKGLSKSSPTTPSPVTSRRWYFRTWGWSNLLIDVLVNHVYGESCLWVWSAPTYEWEDMWFLGTLTYW